VRRGGSLPSSSPRTSTRSLKKPRKGNEIQAIARFAVRYTPQFRVTIPNQRLNSADALAEQHRWMLPTGEQVRADDGSTHENKRHVQPSVRSGFTTTG